MPKTREQVCRVPAYNFQSLSRVLPRRLSKQNIEQNELADGYKKDEELFLLFLLPFFVFLGHSPPKLNPKDCSGMRPLNMCCDRRPVALRERLTNS